MLRNNHEKEKVKRIKQLSFNRTVLKNNYREM